jgi:3-dehydroquinate dehydratase / shikimate dehydrogenase
MTAVTLPDVDSICVVIGRTRHGMLLHEIAEAAKAGAKLIEVRLDFLKKAPDFKRLLENKPCAMVATVRRPPDGGKWAGGEDARKILLRQAIVAGFDWVDLETDTADAIPRFGPVRRIVSYHNRNEMPADLEGIHARMCAQDADIVKVVVRATQPSDNLRILALVKNAAKPTVAFCMGDMGFPSRILQAKFGSPFTYAAFNKERNIAPGMPSFDEVRKLYHYEHIDADTAVFGVIGDPVGHSLGPLIHNIAFRKLGMNAVYLPFRVPRDTLPAFLAAFEELPVRGYSVTIPHKEAAAAIASGRDSTVERTGAANTLVHGAEGFIAFNTDYGGVIQTLQDLLPTFTQATVDPAAISPAILRPHINLPAGALTAPTPMTGEAITDKPWAPAPAAEPATYTMSASLAGRVGLVLGAGGLARAVAHALHREGCVVTVCNRTAERATALANEIGCRHVDWNARHSVLCDLVINCTSIGMHPKVDELPLHPSFLKPGLVVFDTVYTPEQTFLIKEARERRCHTITGVELFVRQAALQFQHFTGRAAPVDLFRKVIRRALSPITLKDEE